MQIKYIPDEKMHFGKKVEAYDPRIGLLKGGPFEVDTIEDFKVIKCGIISTARNIAKTTHLIEKITNGFDANNKVYGSLGFPGLGIKSPLRFSLRLSEEWQDKIIEKEINHLRNMGDLNDRKEALIDLIEGKVNDILQVDQTPDIIFITLTEELTNLFKRQGIASDSIVFANRNFPNTVFNSNGDIDFHNIVKIIGMKHSIRTQIIKPSTLLFDGTEDEVTTSWNLAVGLYYKANGIPWKFSKLDDNTCYFGVSFYRDFSENDVIMNTSMAQVFLSTGESFILRGEKFKWERTSKELTPHLDEEMATHLINKVLKLYYNQKSTYPARVVIYKTSKFYKEEINGFYNNESKIGNIDMITINPFTRIRLYRQTKHPVMRGTMLSTLNQNKCYLYTFGYLPKLMTYPGMRAPIPLEVEQFTDNNDLDTICKEILTLTRLDWNNIKYCQKMPVTLAFSKKVGEILSEKRAQDTTIKNHYRYYM